MTEPSEKEKTQLEKAENLLKLAKVNVDNVCDEIQSLVFSDSLLSSEEFRLIELNTKLVDHINNGGSLFFRGNPDDIPVLCTETETFQVKEAETSNNLLLLPEFKLKDDMTYSDPTSKHVTFHEIDALTSRYLELRPIKRFNSTRMKQLLKQCSFAGSDKEEEENGKKYTLSDLVTKVQGSEKEIETALENLPVCLINGFLRWLDFDYMTQIISEITDVCDNIGCDSWKNISFEQIQNSLDQPFVVLDRILRWFGKENQSNIWSLDERMVCRFFAEMLLRKTETKQFEYEEFSKIWYQCVPFGMKPTMKHLQGLALIEESVLKKSVKYFPVEDLPEEPQERFRLIFQERSRWKHDDLSPYLVDLADSPKEVGALLTKFCRSSTVDGVRWYNTR